MEPEIKFILWIGALIASISLIVCTALTIQINIYTSRGYTKTTLPGCDYTVWVLPEEVE